MERQSFVAVAYGFVKYPSAASAIRRGNSSQGTVISEHLKGVAVGAAPLLFFIRKLALKLTINLLIS